MHLKATHTISFSAQFPPHFFSLQFLSLMEVKVTTLSMSYHLLNDCDSNLTLLWLLLAYPAWQGINHLLPSELHDSLRSYRQWFGRFLSV